MLRKGSKVRFANKHEETRELTRMVDNHELARSGRTAIVTVSYDRKGVQWEKGIPRFLDPSRVECFPARTIKISVSESLCCQLAIRLTFEVSHQHVAK